MAKEAELAAAVDRLAGAVTARGAGPGTDATGGAVWSLTEATMGITAALSEVARALSEIAEAIREKDLKP